RIGCQRQATIEWPAQGRQAVQPNGPRQMDQVPPAALALLQLPRGQQRQRLIVRGDGGANLLDVHDKRRPGSDHTSGKVQREWPGALELTGRNASATPTCSPVTTVPKSVNEVAASIRTSIVRPMSRSLPS